MTKIRRVLLTVLTLALLRRPLDLLLPVMLPDAAVDPVPQMIAGAGLCLLLLGLPAWLMRPWTSVRLRRDKSLLKGLALAIGATLLCRWAMMPADHAWQTVMQINSDSYPAPESIPAAMLSVLLLAVIPAVLEEAFFRGALLTALLDGSRRATAVLLTAVTFALMHGRLASLPSLMTLSLLLTLLMLYSGSILVPMAAHLVYNLTALVQVPLPGWGRGLCGAGLALLGMYLCIRQPKYAHQPMKWPDGLIAAAAVIVLTATYIV